MILHYLFALSLVNLGLSLIAQAIGLRFLVIVTAGFGAGMAALSVYAMLGYIS